MTGPSSLSSGGAAPPRASAAVLASTASRVPVLSALPRACARTGRSSSSPFGVWGLVGPPAASRGRRVAAHAIRAPHVGAAAVLVEPEVVAPPLAAPAGGDVASVLLMANEVSRPRP